MKRLDITHFPLDLQMQCCLFIVQAVWGRLGQVFLHFYHSLAAMGLFFVWLFCDSILKFTHSLEQKLHPQCVINILMTWIKKTLGVTLSLLHTSMLSWVWKWSRHFGRWGTLSQVGLLTGQCSAHALRHRFISPLISISKFRLLVFSAALPQHCEGVGVTFI